MSNGEKEPTDGGENLEQAAANVEAALIGALASRLPSTSQATREKAWWERPAFPILIAAVLGGVDPIVSAISEWRVQSATTANEMRVSTRERRLEYARTLMAAENPDRRLELLAMIVAAPQSDSIDRAWATTEQARVANEYADVQAQLAEAEESLREAQQQAFRARQAAIEAERRAEIQRALLAEAEEAAQASDAEIEALRDSEREAIADAEQARQEADSLAMLRDIEASVTKSTDIEQLTEARVGVPESFSLRSARDVLEGDASAMWSLVVWSDSPQGHSFWREELRRLERGQPLTDEARTQVEAWIRLAEARGDAEG